MRRKFLTPLLYLLLAAAVGVIGGILGRACEAGLDAAADAGATWIEMDGGSDGAS